MKFEWLEDDLAPRFDRVCHDVPSFWRRIAVSRPDYFREADVVLNTRTGEQFLVLHAGPRLDVRRGFGSTSAPTRRGDELLILGNLS